MRESSTGLGGLKAPCRPFDYRKMERDALEECRILKSRLAALKRQKPREKEKEMLRRWEMSVITGIFYEQRHQAQLFRKRAEERENASRLPEREKSAIM